MGLRSRLKRAADIAAAPVRGAVKGAQDVGALPTKNTVRGALRGDKSDIATLGITAAAAIPAIGGARRLSTVGRAASTLPEIRPLAAGVSQVAPHIRAAARAQRAGASASAGMSMGARASYIAGRASTRPGIGDLLSSAKATRQPRTASVSRWIAGERGAFEPNKIVNFPARSGDAVRRMKNRIMGSMGAQPGPTFESASQKMRGALKELGAGDAVGPGKPRTMTGYMQSRFGEARTSAAIAKAEGVGAKLEGIARMRRPKAAVARGEQGWVRVTGTREGKDFGFSELKIQFGKGGANARRRNVALAEGFKRSKGEPRYDLDVVRHRQEGQAYVDWLGRTGGVGRGTLPDLVPEVARTLRKRGVALVEYTPVPAGHRKPEGGRDRLFSKLISQGKKALSGGERGSLDTDKYMDMIRKRFKEGAPTGLNRRATAPPPIPRPSLVELTDKAIANPPPGHIVGAVMRNRAGVGKGARRMMREVEFTSENTLKEIDDAGKGRTLASVTEAVKKLSNRTPEESAAIGEQSAAAVRRAFVMNKRINRGAGGAIRGFYEKVKSERGSLKLPGTREMIPMEVKEAANPIRGGASRPLGAHDSQVKELLRKAKKRNLLVLPEKN